MRRPGASPPSVRTITTCRTNWRGSNLTWASGTEGLWTVVFIPEFQYVALFTSRKRKEEQPQTFCLASLSCVIRFFFSVSATRPHVLLTLFLHHHTRTGTETLQRPSENKRKTENSQLLLKYYDRLALFIWTPLDLKSSLKLPTSSFPQNAESPLSLCAFLILSFLNIHLLVAQEEDEWRGSGCVDTWGFSASGGRSPAVGWWLTGCGGGGGVD